MTDDIPTLPDRDSPEHLCFSNAVQAEGRSEGREWQLFYTEEVLAGEETWQEQYWSSLRLVKARYRWTEEGENPRDISDPYYDSGKFQEDWEWVHTYVQISSDTAAEV